MKEIKLRYTFRLRSRKWEHIYAYGCLCFSKANKQKIIMASTKQNKINSFPKGLPGLHTNSSQK